LIVVALMLTFLKINFWQWHQYYGLPCGVKKAEPADRLCKKKVNRTVAELQWPCRKKLDRQPAAALAHRR